VLIHHTNYDILTLSLGDAYTLRKNPIAPVILEPIFTLMPKTCASDMVIVVDSKNPFLADALAGVGDVRQLETPAITNAALRDVDAVVVRSETKVGASLLEGTPVQFVGTATIGTDHVDLGYLEKCGIGFASAPGSNANSVAEYVAAALLETAARLSISLKEKILGVVGVGNVGSRVVRVGRALGMRVLQNDPPLARTTGDPVFVPLDAVMEADVLTLHAPLTRAGDDPTFHLFDRERFSRMKRGSILINTARGPLVDSKALHSVLTSGHLGGAVLDVWEGEPDIDPVLLDRVLIGTPHIAGYSFDGKVNAARMMFDAIVRHFGLGRQWPVSVNMPAPHAGWIDLQAAANAQEAIRSVVARCYTIEEDDKRFRTLVRLPDDARRAEFRRQRGTYRVRREFHATRIVAASGKNSIWESLASLGFTMQVSHEEV
jgi:erythronate-4-phosphate dehydrogenase